MSSALAQTCPHYSTQWLANRHKLFLSPLVKTGEYVVDMVCWMPHLFNLDLEPFGPKAS